MLELAHRRKSVILEAAGNASQCIYCFSEKFPGSKNKIRDILHSYCSSTRWWRSFPLANLWMVHLRNLSSRILWSHYGFSSCSQKSHRWRHRGIDSSIWRAQGEPDYMATYWPLQLWLILDRYLKILKFIHAFLDCWG